MVRNVDSVELVFMYKGECPWKMNATIKNTERCSGMKSSFFVTQDVRYFASVAEGVVNMI